MENGIFNLKDCGNIVITLKEVMEQKETTRNRGTWA